MSPTRVRQVTLVGGVALLVLGGLLAKPWPANAGDSAAVAPVEKDSPKVKGLLQERLAIFRELARQAEAAYKGGAASPTQLHQANLMVLNAELDLCETPKERVAVLEKTVSLVKQHEEQVTRILEGKAIPASVVLKAKVARLEAEIALERAKAEAARQPK